MNKVSFAGEVNLTSSRRFLAHKVCFLGLEIFHLPCKYGVNNTVSDRVSRKKKMDLSEILHGIVFICSCSHNKLPDPMLIYHFHNPFLNRVHFKTQFLCLDLDTDQEITHLFQKWRKEKHSDKESHIPLS